MARPERNNIDYFPYLCKEGKAMFYIEQKYGNDGFATWVKILRQLAVTNYHYLNLNDRIEFMFLSSKCKVSELILNEIISDLCDLGEFNKTLWVENKILFNEKFIESIQDAYIKRNNKCITLNGLFLLLISLGVRKLSKIVLEVPVNTQSIVEETIVKEKKVNNIPVENEFLNYCKEVLKEKYSGLEFSLKSKYKSWVENNWKDGHEKPIKNWKTKILNTIPFLKSETLTKNLTTAPQNLE